MAVTMPNIRAKFQYIKTIIGLLVKDFPYMIKLNPHYGYRLNHIKTESYFGMAIAFKTRAEFYAYLCGMEDTIRYVNYANANAQTKKDELHKLIVDAHKLILSYDNNDKTRYAIMEVENRVGILIMMGNKVLSPSNLGTYDDAIRLMSKTVDKLSKRLAGKHRTNPRIIEGGMENE